MQRIDKFLDLIDQSSSPLSIDFEKLNRLTKNLHTDYTSNDENPVKFYTIHKAKGMQFKCVIIPGLGRKDKAEDHALISYDGDILSLNNNKGEEDNLYTYQRSKEVARLKNEKIRLLYVAITRAEWDCHLIGTVSENKKGELSIPKNSFLKILWPLINERKIQEVGVYESDDYKIFEPKLRRLKSKYFNREMDKITQIPSSKTAKNSVNSIDNIYTITGTLIHKYYEITIKKQLDINKLLSNKLSFIYDLFSKIGYQKSEINYAMEVVKESLLSLQKSKDGQWIYQLHEDDRMEVNYLHSIADEDKILIPDRTFIEDGKRWIIDYKTVFDDKLDLEIEAKTHIEQLQIYESLFDDGYLIQKAIYFVRQGKLILI
jgi:ATP-dependent helicase/nuclease subunit A